MRFKKLKIILFCPFLILSVQAYSQTGFLQVFTNPQWILASSVTVNDAGELFSAGTTDGEDNLFFLQADSGCSPLWSKKLEGIAQTCEKVLYQDGFYYAYGSTRSYGEKQLYVAKLDTAGTMVWFKTLGFTHDPQASDAIISSDNEIVLIGQLMDTAAFRYSSFFAKLDTNGAVVTSTNFSDTLYSIRLNKVTQTGNNFIIVGTYGFGFLADYLILSVDQSGSLNYSRAYSESAGWLSGVQTFSNGDFIVTGWTDNHPNGHWKELLTMKFSSSGDRLWTKTFGGELALDEAASNSLVTSDNDVLIHGTSNGRAMVIKIDSSGTLLNSKVYRINSDSVLLELFYQFIEVPGQRFVGIGSSLVEEHPQEIFIMNLNNDLSTACKASVDSLVADTMSLPLFQLQPVVTSDTLLDTLRTVNLVNYVPAVHSACDEVNDIPDVSSGPGFSIYPNPANHLLHVTSSSPLRSAEITNILGETVLSSGESVIDIEKLSPGIYFIRLQNIQSDNRTFRILKQ